MDKATEKYIGLGIGLAVLFIALNAVNGVFTGSLSASWSTAVVTAAAFLVVVLIIILYRLATHAAGGGRE
jgi:uncharacterized membrane protein